MNEHRQAFLDARQAVHDTMSDPAVYVEPGKAPRIIGVRLIRGKPEKTGQAKGMTMVVQFQAVAPKVIFLRAEVPNPAAGAVVIISPVEAFEIAKGGVERPYNLTITAEAKMLAESEALTYPNPQSFRP